LSVWPAASRILFKSSPSVLGILYDRGENDAPDRCSGREATYMSQNSLIRKFMHSPIANPVLRSRIDNRVNDKLRIHEGSADLAHPNCRLDAPETFHAARIVCIISLQSKHRQFTCGVEVGCQWGCERGVERSPGLGAQGDVGFKCLCAAEDVANACCCGLGAAVSYGQGNEKVCGSYSQHCPHCSQFRLWCSRKTVPFRGF